MTEITALMKSHKETRLAPSTMSTIDSLDRAAVNCIVLITKQSWEDVVKSLIEQAHYRGNMPSYKTWYYRFVLKKRVYACSIWWKSKQIA